MSKGITAIALCAFLGVASLACSDQKPGEVSMEQKTADDATISAAVEAKLQADPALSARNIDAETNDGIVTLKGNVKSKQEAEHALHLARNSEKVREVISELKIEPAQSTGDVGEKIERGMNELGEKAEKGLEETGEAIEEGVEEAREAVDSGLKKAEDKTVDAAITTEIKAKFAKDDLVEASDIDVDTENQRVTLKGTVSSQAEEDRAIQIAAQVRNVVTVNSQLIIQQ